MKDLGQGCWLVGEYFATSKENISFRDKASGRQSSFEVTRHTVLVGTTPAVVTERVDEGKPHSCASVKRGELVAFKLSKLEEGRGVVSASGVRVVS